LSLEEALRLRNQWREEGKKVVFTNGCFDLIHPGHALYLEDAKKLGDRLIVAVNSDDSVRRLKGPERPIQNEKARSIVLASMAAVDMVILFTNDTPLDVITKLRPDLLVKGGDWKKEEIVGSDVVLKSGGDVRSIRFEEGFSTTNIIDKITKNHEG